MRTGQTTIAQRVVETRHSLRVSTGDAVEMLKASAPQPGIHGDMDFTPRYRLLDRCFDGLVRTCKDPGTPLFDMGAEGDDAVERVVRRLSASAKPA